MSNYSQDKDVNRCWFSESNILDSSLHQHLKSDPYRVISRCQMMAHSDGTAAVFWLFRESRHIRVITGWWLSSKRSHHTVRTYSDPSKWMMCNYCLSAPLPNPPHQPLSSPGAAADTRDETLPRRQITLWGMTFAAVVSPAPESVLNQRWLFQFKESAL